MEHDVFQVADVEVRYNPSIRPSDRPAVTDAVQCAAMFRQRWNLDTIEYIEEFKIMLLTRKQRVLGIRHIATGSMHGTIVDPKVIFGIALSGGAHSIILAHNHPSGILTPSHADLALTRRLLSGGLLLDLQITDHIILSRTDHLSFVDEGLL